MKKIELENNTIYQFSRENWWKKRYIRVSKRNPFWFYVEFYRASEKKDKEPQRTFVRYTDIPKMIEALLDIHKVFTLSKKNNDWNKSSTIQPATIWVNESEWQSEKSWD